MKKTFIALISFMLGRLSKKEVPGLKIKYPSEYSSNFESLNQNLLAQPVLNNQNKNVSESRSEKFYFASKNGNKYYSIECSSGKNIKKENKIYFSSKEKAEQAGYELSSACK